MKRIICGFFMAWGCFCSIPCPVRKWDEKYRGAMLETFPAAGLLIGTATCAFWILADAFTGSILTGILTACIYFLLTGFIHLDGYMDCCDAILSRRPEREERIRILKDPHSGSFAVMGAVLVTAVSAGSFIEISETLSSEAALMTAAALTWSRTFSAYDVMTKEPIKESQYSVKTDGKPAAAVVLALIVSVAVFAVDRSVTFALYLAGLILVMRIVSGIAGRCARKSLGGMNGDISGFMIVISEAAAFIYIAAVL